MSIKQQLIARILELLETLKVSGQLRTVERITTANQLGAKRPSVHVIVGAEANISEEEDLRGYVCEFPVAIILLVEHPKDAAGAADELTGPIQEAIEGDIQLSGLATKIVYQSAEPFSTEHSKPLGGMEITYLVQYRRRRAQTSTSY